MKEIERALQKEILVDLSELERMGVGTEEHISGMRTVCEAVDRLTKLEEIKQKAITEEAKRLSEEAIASAQAEQARRCERNRIVSDMVGIGVPAIISCWAFITGLLYEERGIVKSPIIRKAFDRIMTMHHR